MDFLWLLKIIVPALILFCAGIHAVDPNSTTTFEDTETSTTNSILTSTVLPDIVTMWKHNDAKSRKMISNLIRSLLPKLLEGAEQTHLSEECKGDLFKFFLGISKMKTWAFTMLDATGKPMDGMMNGAFSSFGSYDQCLDIEVPKSKGSSELRFRGKYCTVKIRPPLPPKPRFYVLGQRHPVFENFSSQNAITHRTTKFSQLFYFVSFRFGVCIPSSCQPDDLLSIAKSLTKDLYLNITVPSCEIKEPLVVETGQIAFVIVLSSLGLLVTVATLLDLYYTVFSKSTTQTPKDTGVKIVLGFSAYSNTIKLLDTSSCSEQLRMLHGVRFFSMSWIILGHLYFFANFQVFRNLNEVINFSKDISFQVIVNASLAVDTFFFISGLLVVYVTMKIVEKTKGKFSVLVFLLHRYWRIIPLTMMFVGGTLLLPWFSSGPLWHESIDHLVEACKNDWWTNLLLINNIHYTKVPCLSHSWFLASDMQLYIMSLAVILPLLRWPRVGMIINVLLILISMLTIGIQNYLGDFPPTMLFSQPDPEQRWSIMRRVYYMPYLHMGPYCVGMAMGYFLYKNKTIRIRPVVQVIGWLLATFLSTSVLYGIYDWNQGHLPSKPVSVVYAATHRTAWALGAAWLTLVCVTGYGGFLNTLLSWKALIPLSRLTFPVYLVHPLIMKVYHASFREEVQTAHFLAVFSYFGFIAVSYMIGFAMNLLVEAPMLALERTLLSRRDEQVIDKKLSTWRKEQEENQKLPDLNKHVMDMRSDQKIILTDPSKKEASNGIDNASFIYRL